MTETPVGRSRAVLALLLLAPAPSLGTAAAMIVAPGPVGHSLFIAAKLWLVLFPAAWWLLVEKGRLSWSPPRRGGFAAGSACGVAMAVVIVAAYLVVAPHLEPSLLRREVLEMGLGSPLLYLAAAAYWIFVNSVLEEYVYRWFVFRQAEQLIPPLGAAVVAAAIFTVHHVIALSQYLSPALNALASAGIFVGGLSWSWCYLRYRSIWPGWVAHALADVAVFGIGWHLLFAG